VTPDSIYVEIVEIRDHPWFLGCQFHPEFKSRPLEPHPLFKAFVGAACQYRKQRLARAERTGTAPAGPTVPAAATAD
jgi:CTP synthase